MQEQLMMEANRILRMLADDKNVLLTGAPATGKTTLLNMAEHLFLERGETTVDPYGTAAFPLRTPLTKGPFLAEGVATARYLGRHFTKEHDTGISFAASFPSQTQIQSSSRFPRGCSGKRQNLPNNPILLPSSSSTRLIAAQPSAFSGT